MAGATVLLLGGYGNAGQAIAAALLGESDSRVIIAGRQGAKAAAVAARLGERFGAARVSAAVMDARDGTTLSLNRVDLLIVASSTADQARTLTQAALDEKVDCLDLQYSRPKIGALRHMAPSIEAAGCCVITDAGAWPGLPAALVRAIANRVDALQRAHVYTLARIDWANREIGLSAVEEIVAAMVEHEAVVFSHGTWARARASDLMLPESVDFGPRYGPHYCAPRSLEEMRTLPDLFPTLTDLGAYLASPRRIAQWLPGLAALVAGGSRSRTRALARLMHWAARRSAAAPYGLMMRAEAGGRADGRAATVSLTLHHEDSYTFTAAAVVACVLQYLDGSVRRPGLWMQGRVVDPDRLLRDMARMGVAVEWGAGAGSQGPPRSRGPHRERGEAARA